jgi:lipopolysaccharide biosynthesis glycosyltransferase
MKEDTTNKIHIGLALDINYVTPFYVLLTSIFYNNKKNDLVIHTISTGIDELEKRRIIDYVEQNRSIMFFYTIDESCTKDLVLPDHPYFTVATYYRLFFPSLLPQSVTRLLHLDIDVVVIGDLSELFNKEVGNAPMAAVAEASVPTRPDLGIHTEGEYFNAGVILINMLEWKEQNISEKAIEYIKSFPEKIIFADQDALNGVLLNNWFKLDYKYNMTIYYGLPEHLPPKKELNNYLQDKVIIHYNTDHKPWLIHCANRLRFLYYFYLERTPNVDHKKYIDAKFDKEQLYNFVKIRIRKLCFDHPIIVMAFRRLKKLKLSR